MSQRIYRIKLTDSLFYKADESTKFDIDSNIHKLQIKTSVTYRSVDAMEDFIVVEVYNLNIKEIPRNWLNSRFIMWAGTKSSYITEMQGIKSPQIALNKVIDGYVWDVSFDYTEMPNVKLVFKVGNSFSRIYDEISRFGYKVSGRLIDRIYNVVSYIRPISLTLKKGEDLINFLNCAFELSFSGLLYNNTGEREIINNIKDVNLELNLNNNNVIFNINEFIRMFVTLDNNILPMCITGQPGGYALNYDFRNFTDDQLIKYFRLKGTDTKAIYDKLEREKTYTSDENYNRNYLINEIVGVHADEFSSFFNIPNSLIISPPLRVGPDAIQINTMLMPSLRPGHLITLGNRVGDEIYTPAAAVVPSKKYSSLAYHNNYSGSFVVDTVEHKLNFQDSSPANWSTVILLLQKPESKKNPYKRLYLKDYEPEYANTKRMNK